MRFSLKLPSSMRFPLFKEDTKTWPNESLIELPFPRPSARLSEQTDGVWRVERAENKDVSQFGKVLFGIG